MLVIIEGEPDRAWCVHSNERYTFRTKTPPMQVMLWDIHEVQLFDSLIHFWVHAQKFIKLVLVYYTWESYTPLSVLRVIVPRFVLKLQLSVLNLKIIAKCWAVKPGNYRLVPASSSY